MDVSGFQRVVVRTAGRYGMELSSPLALVSGGPDSTALLRALVGLGCEPVVLHVDHGLRGEGSRGDAEFVQGLCGELGLRCETRKPEIPGGSGLQERARRERYDLAGRLASEVGASAIATGHTADDVAETVLMNLARGSGLRGISGIPPVSGNVVRPLIEHRRAEVLDYLEALGQTYRVDPTNSLPKYARNRVRNEALPVLEELYPGAGANVARAARLIRDDLAALESLAARAVREDAGERVIPAESGLHVGLRRHAVRYAYSGLAPLAPPLDSSAVESVLALASHRGTLDLPSGVVAASRAGGEVALYKGGEPESVKEAVEPVGIAEGETRIAGWSVWAREAPLRGGPPDDAGDPAVAYLDADRGPYGVRLVREGDVVRPLGLGGTKKVLQAMMDRKVPKDLRRRTPVVVGGDGRVAWVVHGEVGEEFALGGGTRRMIRLEAAQESPEVQKPTGI